MARRKLTTSVIVADDQISCEVATKPVRKSMGQINSNMVPGFLARTSASALGSKRQNSDQTTFSSSADSSDSDSSSAPESSVSGSDSGVSDVPYPNRSSGVLDSYSYNAFIAYQSQPLQYEYLPPTFRLPEPAP